jgi:hypothetical protein
VGSVKAKLTNLTMIVFAIGLVWLVNADAAIYKWKDENGKTHFTDNPTKVPKAFRKKPFIKDSNKPRSRNKNPQTSTRRGAKPAEPEKKEKDKEGGLTEEEQTTAKAVENFLNEDIPRYEKFYVTKSSLGKTNLLKKTLAEATSQKQTLLEKVNQHDTPLFKEVAGFLEKSIAEDEKFQKIITAASLLRRTTIQQNRLKSETEQEKQLLKKLTKALETKPEKVETVKKSPPPAQKPKSPKPGSETPPEKSGKKQEVPRFEKAVEQPDKKEGTSFEEQIKSTKNLLRQSEEKRASQLEKLEELKDLDYKPKKWTTEDSLEEVIQKLEEGIKKTDQEILKYKEKLKTFSIQD